MPSGDCSQAGPGQSVENNECGRAGLPSTQATAYTYVYAVARRGGPPMQRTAKIFMNNRSQAVRLPKEFQFNTSEVFIRKQGDEVVLSARPKGLVCLPGDRPSRLRGIHGGHRRSASPGTRTLMPVYMLDTDTSSYIMKRSARCRPEQTAEGTDQRCPYLRHHQVRASLWRRALTTTLSRPSGARRVPSPRRGDGVYRRSCSALCPNPCRSQNERNHDRRK